MINSKKYIIYIIVLLTLCSINTFGQVIKLNKKVVIDTLYVSLTQTDKSDIVLNKKLQTQFDSLIADFNLKPKSYKIVIDSTRSKQSIQMTMGTIKYVDTKKSLWVTGMDLALVGANFLIFPSFPVIIPFYLLPGTLCMVKTKCTPDLVKMSPKLFINPYGYFKKKEKQKKLFKTKFNSVFLKLFNEIDKQNIKNLKQY